jgi:uncharacterized protein (TIGR04255 family)
MSRHTTWDAMPRLEFDNPPIDELICGLEFEPPLGPDFRIPHIGAFWQQVRADFPKCEHAQPIATQGQLLVDPETGIPLPRVWLISENEQKLMQIQRDRILFNWRKRAPDHVYIRFAAALQQLVHGVRQFWAFLDGERIATPKAQKYELTYTNILTKGAGWDQPADIAKLIRITPPSEALSAFPNLLATSGGAAGSLPDGRGELAAKVAFGNRVIDGTPIYKFDLTARGLGESNSIESMEEWFRFAHDQISDLFVAITTERAQYEIWRRRDRARQ